MSAETIARTDLPPIRIVCCDPARREPGTIRRDRKL
jgi:hypothetical protein